MRFPHIFTRKSRLQPGEFLITSAKRLLQQYLPEGDICPAVKRTTIRSPRRRGQAASAVFLGRVPASRNRDRHLAEMRAARHVGERRLGLAEWKQLVHHR